jgi:hypothetical protein
MQAQENYEDLYYGLGSDDDNLVKPMEEDFCEPLQLAEESSVPAHSSGSYMTVTSELKGESIDLREPRITVTSRVDVNTPIDPFSINESSPTVSTTSGAQIPTGQMFSLNRHSCRRLAKDIRRSTYTIQQGDCDELPLIELTKVMARPPGCSFLGSKAVKVPGIIGELGDVSTEVIVDSGSDITLISEKTWKELRCRPKIWTGQ